MLFLVGPRSRAELDERDYPRRYRSTPLGCARRPFQAEVPPIRAVRIHERVDEHARNEPHCDRRQRDRDAGLQSKENDQGGEAVPVEPWDRYQERTGRPAMAAGPIDCEGRRYSAQQPRALRSPKWPPVRFAETVPPRRCRVAAGLLTTAFIIPAMENPSTATSANSPKNSAAEWRKTCNISRLGRGHPPPRFDVGTIE